MDYSILLGIAPLQSGHIPVSEEFDGPCFVFACRSSCVDLAHLGGRTSSSLCLIQPW